MVNLTEDNLQIVKRLLEIFYKRLLNFSVSSSALMGDFQEIQTVNRQSTQGFDAGIYAFTRWSDTQNNCGH
jgi:hypothetical protein